MKKNVWLCMLTLGLWVGTSACSDDSTEQSSNTLTVSPTRIEISPEGGSREITVETTAASWEYTVNADWCEVQKADNKLTVTLPAYSETVLRTAQIVVKADKAEDQTIEVRQSAAAEATLAVEPKTLEFLAKNPEPQTIALETNQATLTISEPTASWCKVEKADDNKTLTVTVESNDDVEREATFSVKAGFGNNFKEEMITVKQADGSIPFEVDLEGEKKLELNTVGYRVMVKVVAKPTDWTVEAADDWCTVTRVDGGIEVSASYNDTDKERTTTVNLVAGDVKFPVEVYQTNESLGAGEPFYYKRKMVGVVVYNGAVGYPWKPATKGNAVIILSAEQKENVQWCLKDANGSFDWSDLANEMGYEPFVGLDFYKEKIQTLSDWKTNYPAFAFCEELDEKTQMEGWHLCMMDKAVPFESDNSFFYNVYKNKDIINATLKEHKCAELSAWWTGMDSYGSITFPAAENAYLFDPVAEKYGYDVARREGKQEQHNVRCIWVCKYK